MPQTAAAPILAFISYMSMAYSVLTAIRLANQKDPIKKDGGILVNTKTTEAVVPLVYGKGRVGGNFAFATTTGSDNTYLHMILGLSEGEINDIAQVSGTDSVTGEFYSGDGVFLNGQHYSKSDHKDHFTYQLFKGSSTQTVCSTLHSAYTPWVDPLRYTAYLYCKFKYNRDNPLSVPAITVVLEGIKVKDFTTENNYDSMPSIYTNNIAYCAYDLLTRPSTRGGKGVDPTRVNLTSFREAATYYDNYGWTSNITLDADQSVTHNLSLLLANGRSEIIYSNSEFHLKFRDTREEVVCFQITDDNIVQNNKESTLEIEPAASLFDRPNAIKTSFYSADKNFHKDEKIYTDQEAFDTEGDYRELAVDLLGLSSLEKVIPMSYYYLERARWGNIVKLTVGSDGIVLEPMDLVEITATMPGWSESSKPLYRVETATMQVDGNVSVLLLQEHDNLYNDAYDVSTQELFYTDLLGPGTEVLGVRNVTHVEEVYYYREKSFTRWLIDFDPPPIEEYPFWDYAEIWLKVGTGDWKFMTMARSDYMVDPVEEGVKYYLKIRSVSTFGAKEDFDNAYTISSKIVGKTGVPTDMDFLTVTSVDDTIFIYSEIIEGPDIIGYEFRISAQSISSWGGAVYLGLARQPTWSLSGMRAGTYRIFCSPLNDSGLYSNNPVYADFIVENPKGYTIYQETDFDYPDGSHNNTEYYNAGAGDYCIRVTHTGGLIGTWTSPIVDVGETRHLRVQGDFVLEVIDANTTWNALWPNPNTWDSLDITNKTWVELGGTDAASKIEAKLKWGVASVSENSVNKFELMSIDTIARYYQLEIKLTDPTNDQYVLLKGENDATVLTLMFMR